MDETYKALTLLVTDLHRAASGGEANEALQTLFLGTGYKQNLPGISFTTSSFLAGLSQYMMFTLELLQF